MRIQRSGRNSTIFSSLTDQTVVVLPEAKAVGLVAMSMLGSDAIWASCCLPVAMLVTINKGKETQLLHEIALMLPELLERWIERV
ncbi:DUF484 family protein [Escherichia coli]